MLSMQRVAHLIRAGNLATPPSIEASSLDGHCQKQYDLGPIQKINLTISPASVNCFADHCISHHEALAVLIEQPSPVNATSLMVSLQTASSK